MEEKERIILDFNKRFANGEQYIIINDNGDIEEKPKSYWWEIREVYNHILPLIESLKGKEVSEEKIYGKGGLVDRLVPYQKEYNDIKSKKGVLLERIIYPFAVVEDGSVDIDSLENEGLTPGRVLVYRQGAQKPIYNFEVDADVFNALDKSASFILSSMYSIFNHWREENNL